MFPRTPAFLATLAVLALATVNSANAQPLAPNRPPAGAFGSFFYPGTTAVANGGISYNGFNGFNGLARQGVNNVNPGVVTAPGFGSLSNYYGPFAPYVLSQQPVVFNSRSHWYSNYYSHWYPNGLTNGTGVLANGGAGGGLRLGGPTATLGGLAAPGGAAPAAGIVGGGMPAAGGGPAVKQ